MSGPNLDETKHLTSSKTPYPEARVYTEGPLKFFPTEVFCARQKFESRNLLYHIDPKPKKRFISGLDMSSTFV